MPSMPSMPVYAHDSVKVTPRYGQMTSQHYATRTFGHERTGKKVRYKEMLILFRTCQEIQGIFPPLSSFLFVFKFLASTCAFSLAAAAALMAAFKDAQFRKCHEIMKNNDKNTINIDS